MNQLVRPARTFRDVRALSKWVTGEDEVTGLLLFIYTIAVVIGVLSPIAALIVLRTVTESWVNFSEGFKLRAERAAKEPPFTDAALRRCPNDRMLVIELYKGKELMWTKGVDKP